MSGRRGWHGLALPAVTALLVLRVGIVGAGFVRESLQMDLAAFWTAGEAVARGLSPYDNHVLADPPLWDGVAAYRHSRFLYPPLVARLFQPLAVVPYALAKWAFTIASLSALAAALALAWRAWGRPAGRTGALALTAVAAGFFPVLTLVERGQIDAVVLLLLLGGAVASRRPRGAWGAGALLAAATLLKLHCAFLLPFVLLRRMWRVAAGFAAGAALLVGLGVAIDGADAWRGYVADELPRISRHGDAGSRADRLPPAAFARVLDGVPPGMTRVDGRVYRPDALEFVLNASAVRTPLGRAVWSGLRGMGLEVAPGHVSLVFLATLVAAIALVARRAGPPPDRVGVPLALTVVLLCAPVTWAMGTVWLLAAVPALLAGLDEWRRGEAGRAVRAGVVLVGAGLALAAAPDPALARLATGPLEPLLRLEYVVAEALVAAGLVVAWLSAPRGRTPPRRAAT